MHGLVAAVVVDTAAQHHPGEADAVAEERALELLVQASRANPTLREAVSEVERWVRRLQEDRASAWQSYEEADVRLKADYLSLARWARQQNAGNAFATQVALYAEARIAEWDLPLEEWEP